MRMYLIYYNEVSQVLLLSTYDCIGIIGLAASWCIVAWRVELRSIRAKDEGKVTVTRCNIYPKRWCSVYVTHVTRMSISIAYHKARSHKAKTMLPLSTGYCNYNKEEETEDFKQSCRPQQDVCACRITIVFQPVKL